jgi:3-methylfumaryl-CoA hydratase
VSADFQAWVGRVEERSERISPSVVDAMAATLDLERAPRTGDPLPPGWQWLFFNPAARRSTLGADGHPQRGGFLPPIELPRRMWAGSRLRYLKPLPVDQQASKRSHILKIEEKTGRRGALVFVTVQHSITCNGEECIAEEQDIVFREAPNAMATAVPKRHEAIATWSRSVDPDTTLLFRYSALTFNSHRIHYDQSYTRNDEGYPDLVVHAPLTATLLQQFAVQCGGRRRLARFDFRGVSPLFVGRAFQLEGRASADDSIELWVRGPDGELAVSGSATFE